MYRYFNGEKNSNMPKRPPVPFFIFLKEFRKEFKKKNPNNKRVADVGKAAGERWRALSEADKAPYVLKAQKLKAEYDEKVRAYKKVEGGVPYDSNEPDMSVADESEFENSKTEKFKFVKVEFDIFESVKSESEVGDCHEKKSKIGKVNGENIKKETEEVEFKTNSYKHLDEVEKIISLPLETMLQSSNLTRLQNILEQVKALPLVNAKLREWCDTFLEVAMVMPRQRINIQNVLMETEAKAQAIVQLQKEAAHIRNSSLEDLQVEKEHLTSIERVEAKIERLKREMAEAEAERASLLIAGEGLATAKYRRVKRELAEAEAERASLLIAGEGLATAKYTRVKRARTVHHDLALLIEQDAAIDKIILDGRNAVKNIDNHLNALIVQFNVLKNAAD